CICSCAIFFTDSSTIMFYTLSLHDALPISVLTLRNLESGKVFNATSSAEGVFRLFPLPRGKYELRAEAQNYAPFVLADLVLQAKDRKSTRLNPSNVATPMAVSCWKKKRISK